MSFSKDFKWCVGGASMQQDGGVGCGGRGASIWDAEYIAGHIKGGDDAQVACDHYHRYKEDFKLLKEIGVNTYRFSISPARIFPHDGNKVNAEGIRFYKDLVSELRRLGIEPLVTLYHWDLPVWLHDKGGWLNPESVQWFARYATVVTEALSDKVQYWLTFNEPSIFVELGYALGTHAPFYKLSDRDIKTISRNIMLAHGKAVQAIRYYAATPPKIGYANASPLVLPVGGKTEQEAYEKTFDAEWNGAFNTSWWADPIVLGEPCRGCDWLSESDLEQIRQPLDFFGFNTYSAESTPDFKHSYAGMPLTTMDWAITPDCLYYTAKFLYKRYSLPVMVTENGMANTDFVYEDGKVHDPQRTEYLRTHIRGLKKAASEGVPVMGYSCWSFLDNFEWAEGYSRRFGLVYVDYRTQKRTLKDSAYEYKKIIETNGENL